MEINPIYTPSDRDINAAAEEAAGLAAETAVSITGVESENQALIRGLLPTDFDPGPDNGWGGSSRRWLQQGMMAGEVNHVYDVDSNASAEGLVVVLFGLTNVNDRVDVSEVEFRDGTSSTFARMPIKFTQQVSDDKDANPETIIFSKLILVGSVEDAEIALWANEDGDASLAFHGFVAEARGNTLTTKASGGMDL